jgi:hypothetical protein
MPVIDFAGYPRSAIIAGGIGVLRIQSRLEVVP